MLVEIYSNENCVQCENTKRVMSKHGIKYTEIMFADAKEKLDQFKEKGFMQAPVVVAGNQIWSGFRLDRIQGLAMQIHGEECKQC